MTPGECESPSNSKANDFDRLLSERALIQASDDPSFLRPYLFSSSAYLRRPAAASLARILELPDLLKLLLQERLGRQDEVVLQIYHYALNQRFSERDRLARASIELILKEPQVFGEDRETDAQRAQLLIEKAPRFEETNWQRRLRLHFEAVGEIEPLIEELNSLKAGSERDDLAKRIFERLRTDVIHLEYSHRRFLIRNMMGPSFPVYPHTESLRNWGTSSLNLLMEYAEAYAHLGEEDLWPESFRESVSTFLTELQEKPSTADIWKELSPQDRDFFQNLRATKE